MDSEKHYYLVMEYGGDNLLDFVIKAHKLIEIGQLEMSEWHRLCKIIFKQMCDSVHHIHSKNVSHYDISLENFLINELNISVNEDKNGKKTIQFMVNHNQGVDMRRFSLRPHNLAQRFLRYLVGIYYSPGAALRLLQD